MGAGRFLKQAEHGGNPTGSLARYNTCSCHPVQWGMKKGLRRARRRYERGLIESELAGVSVEPAENDCDQQDPQS